MAARDPEYRNVVSRSGAEKTNTGRVSDETRTEIITWQIRNFVTKKLTDAPPLSAAQIARLRGLFGSDDVADPSADADHSARVSA